MKRLILLSVLLISCNQNSGPSRMYGPLEIIGFQFETTQAPLFKNAVESSVVSYNGSLVYLSDIGIDKTVSVGTAESMSVFDYGLNRSYVFEHNGIYYYAYNSTGDKIYLKKSTDLVNWQMMNSGNPIMTTHVGEIYGGIWNPSIAIDDNGLWHMLVECETNGDNSIAGLGYATATLNGDMINFDLNRSPNYVIERAGNSWLTFVPGRGMLVVYGKISSPIGDIGNEWYITAATMENGVFQENPNFIIGAPGIHVADPHVVETQGGLVMTLSYDQYSVYELRSGQTMEQLYDSVRQ